MVSRRRRPAPYNRGASRCALRLRARDGAGIDHRPLSLSVIINRTGTKVYFHKSKKNHYYCQKPPHRRTVHAQRAYHPFYQLGSSDLVAFVGPLANASVSSRAARAVRSSIAHSPGRHRVLPVWWGEGGGRRVRSVRAVGRGRAITQCVGSRPGSERWSGATDAVFLVECSSVQWVKPPSVTGQVQRGRRESTMGAGEGS